MKKIIALVLSLILALSACMIPVSADTLSDISDKIQTEAEDAVNDTKFIFEATIVRFKNAVHRVIEVLSNLFGTECPWCAAGAESPDAETPEDSEELLLYYENLLGISNNISLDDNDNNNIPDALEDMFDIDTDGDCISDWLEKIYKTDPMVADTDTDGLNDGYELMVLGTDPLKTDSDNNGLSDANEDFDKDGLSNLTEQQLKTNPNKKDTDEDGLSDYDEYSLTETDPTIKDTDKDGLNDGDELTYSMNPTNPDSLNDGTLDGNRIFSVNQEGPASDGNQIEVAVDIDLKGNQIESLTVEKVDSDDVFLNIDIPGYIGNAYDFNVDGEFNSATVSFNLDPNLFDDPNFDPAIYYWDTENEILIELDNQVLSGTTISATLEHFSNYIVLNKSKYEASVLEYEIEAPTDQELQNKKFDIILTLDESGSIGSSDFSVMKTRCIELLSYLAAEDRIGIITFDDSVRTILNLSDKATAENAIKNLVQHDGNTALYTAIDKAATQLQNEEGSTKIIVALTDGKDNSSSVSSSTVTTKLKNNNIVLYTIGVGSSVSSSVLKEMAENTGGQYYPVSSFSNLSAVFERIISNADLYKDSDEDGISDYHEKCIANGKLKTGTGATINCFNSLSYLNNDSDADGLFDGEEIEIRERIVNGKIVYYCYMHSNPCMTDTDGDELEDYIEIYAGFSPLLNNTINPNASPSSSPLQVNTFKEWIEMVKNNSWNLIHNAVQTDIVVRYPGMLAEIVLKPSKRRVDLLWPMTAEIWDVKPASYQFGDNLEKGLNQLEDYCNLAHKMDPADYPEDTDMSKVHQGGSLIKDRSISVGNYNVQYTNMQNGIIAYHFESTIPIAPPLEQPETVEKPATETEWYEYLWNVAKNAGYSVAAFGEAVLDAIAGLGTAVCNYADEIITTGIMIGGILGIAYIIAHLLPVVVFA